MYVSIAAIEARGVQPLLEMLLRLGGWPVLQGDTWNERSFSWEESVYRFREAGYSVDYFLDFSISVDVKNSTKRIIDASGFYATSMLTLNIEKYYILILF